MVLSSIIFLKILFCLILKILSVFLIILFKLIIHQTPTMLFFVCFELRLWVAKAIMVRQTYRERLFLF